VSAAADTLLVVGDGGLLERIAEALRGAGLRLRHVDEADVAEVLTAASGEAGSSLGALVIGPGLTGPLAVARTAHRLAPLVELVFVVAPEDAEATRETLTRAPLIGRHWTLASPDDDVLADIVGEALRRTRQRLTHRATLERMNRKMREYVEGDEVGRGLIVSTHHLASILEHADDAIFAVDDEGAVASWNRGGARMFARERFETIGRSVAVLVAEEQAQELLALVERVRRGDVVRNSPFGGRRADGTSFDAEFTLAAVDDGAGRPAFVSVIVHDVTARARHEAEVRALNATLERRVRDLDAANSALTAALELLETKKQELQRLNEALERQATTDALTGLKNRVVFQNSLVEMIAVARRQGTPFSVLVIDVDHFKRVNDTWGHQRGDEVLQLIARTLTAHTREQDVVARYGGEEFAVLLPNTGLASAVVVAEHLRAACQDLVEIEPKLTVSVGAASLAPGDGDVTLVARADEALYAAKAQGRNRVTAAEAPSGGVAQPRRS
jgi:diguanylate cyclase (GGDEF)-like protein/PAS domain S-box-containing protein